jgi:hypothetical protein
MMFFSGIINKNIHDHKKVYFSNFMANLFHDRPYCITLNISNIVSRKCHILTKSNENKLQSNVNLHVTMYG